MLEQRDSGGRRKRARSRARAEEVEELGAVTPGDVGAATNAGKRDEAEGLRRVARWRGSGEGEAEEAWMEGGVTQSTKGGDGGSL